MAKKREETTVTAEPERECIQLETFASFCRRHGKYIVVNNSSILASRPGVYSQKLIFEDGATAMYVTDRAYGGEEPPSDLVQRTQNQLAFAEEMLDREVKEYERFANFCNEQAEHHVISQGTVPPPPANFAEQLAKGAGRIAQRKEKVVALNAILDKHDPVRIERSARIKRDNEELERRRGILNRVRDACTNALVAISGPNNPTIGLGE